MPEIRRSLDAAPDEPAAFRPQQAGWSARESHLDVKGTLGRRVELATALGEASDVAKGTVTIAAATLPPWLLSRASTALRQEFACDASGALLGCAGFERFGADPGMEPGVSFTRAGRAIVLNGQLTGVACAPETRLLFVLSEANGGDQLILAVPIGPSSSLRGIGDGLASLRFENTRVDESHVVEASDTDLRIVLAEHYLTLAAMARGLAKSALRETGQHIIQRQMFGRRQGSLQVVRHKMADLHADYRIACAFLDDVVAGPANEYFVRRAAMAARTVGLMSRKVCEGCLQLFGGRGYLTDNRIARAYRDLVKRTSLLAPPTSLMWLATNVGER